MASQGTPCQSSALSFETDENPWNVVIIPGISRFWERFHLDLAGRWEPPARVEAMAFLRRLTPSRILQQFFADVRQLARPQPPVFLAEIHRFIILSPTKWPWNGNLIMFWNPKIPCLESIWDFYFVLKMSLNHFIFSKTVSFFPHFLGPFGVVELNSYSSWRL